MVTENKVYLEADVVIEKETLELKEKASKVIELPKEGEKQPDLLYFSAIFVSSGENLNHAYFLGSELLTAEGTIVNKAMDVEHDTSSIVGHIYDRKYIDHDNNVLDLNELAKVEKSSQDSQQMHVAIAGVIYKDRFPNLSTEVAANKWKVSMECYYSEYDVKIGDLILTKNEAEALGLAAQDDKLLGRMAKVMKKGVAIAAGNITRVLRGICFSGCGFVKNPANPVSLVLETANTAKSKGEHIDDEVIVFDYDKLQLVDNKVTSDIVGNDLNKETATDGLLDDTVGICVSYKKTLQSKDGTVIESDWCTLYERSCTSFSRDTTDHNCLRSKEELNVAKARIKERFIRLEAEDKRETLLQGLKAAFSEAVKSKSRWEE